MEFPEIIALYNTLFTKEKVNFIPEHSLQSNIMFMKWLMREPELLPIIRPLVDYLFYVSGKHFFALLYTHIPKRLEAPRIKKKGTKINIKSDKVLEKIKEVIGWSDLEMEKNMEIVEKAILKDRTHWQKEFGLK
jgi:hypothetical protein